MEHNGYYLDWILRPKILITIIKSWWILLLWPMILYVVLDCDGYYQVLQILTRDSLSPFTKPWWVLPFSKGDSLCYFGLWQVLPFSKDYDQRFFSIIFPVVMGIVLYMWYCIIVCSWQRSTLIGSKQKLHYCFVTDFLICQVCYYFELIFQCICHYLVYKL